MKSLFIPAKIETEINLNADIVKRLEKKKIGLVTTIQYLDTLKQVKKQLPESIIAGQVLGCDASSAEKIKDKVDAFLYIGSGRFHPLNVAEKTGKPTYTYDPNTKNLNKIDPKEIEQTKKRKKGSLLRFMSSTNIGILVSTKPGQKKLKEARALAKKLKEEKKKPYIFISETLDINQLENFPAIQCFVNTACPRIWEDTQKHMINLEDLPN